MECRDQLYSSNHSLPHDWNIDIDHFERYFGLRNGTTSPSAYHFPAIRVRCKSPCMPYGMLLAVCMATVTCIILEECLAFLASGSDPTCRVSIIYTTWPKSHAYHGVPRLEKS